MFGENKVAIVTGVGPGMGRSIALGFARSGVDVALAARRPDRLEAVADEVRNLGREPLICPTDITDASACGTLVRSTVARFGGVDYLVQNGHHEGDWAAVLDAEPDDWRKVFEVNVFAGLHLVQSAVPEMRTRQGGAVVLINSGAALRTPVNMGSYSASKAALANLTRTLALEIGPVGVRVNGVFLGPVAGENLSRLAETAARASGTTVEEWLRAKASEMPLGFIPTADQCAGSVLFLCSDLASAVTGQHISVNGGQWVT